MRYIFILLLCLICTVSFADTLSYTYTYATTDEVTSVKLNQNNKDISTIVNGKLNNDNAKTSSGFRFYEALGSLPTAGTLGRMVFDLTENELSIDKGGTWASYPAITSSLTNRVVCWKGDKTLGHCTDQPDASGICTCN